MIKRLQRIGASQGYLQTGGGVGDKRNPALEEVEVKLRARKGRKAKAKIEEVPAEAVTEPEAPSRLEDDPIVRAFLADDAEGAENKE